MKLLKNIPIEKYNNVQYILNYLKETPTIDNEYDEPIEYFHCFWKGALSNLHLMCLDSLIKTHPTAQIILWTTDLFQLNGSMPSLKIKKLLKDHLEINEVDKNLFNNADAEFIYANFMLLANQNNQASLAYCSDIIRFIILQVYGGLWFDMDILFLRDFNNIKLKRYTSQWGTDNCGNAAIMRLEKNHNLIKNIYSKYERPFYPTTTFKLENDLDIVIIPSTFFDILWRPQEQIPNNLQFKYFDDFFKIKELNLPKEIFAYHWHNRWNNPTPLFFK